MNHRAATNTFRQYSLAEQCDSIRILHNLTPIGVAMEGANEREPDMDCFY